MGHEYLEFSLQGFILKELVEERGRAIAIRVHDLAQLARPFTDGFMYNSVFPNEAAALAAFRVWASNNGFIDLSPDLVRKAFLLSCYWWK